jgi:hypothetical protein
MGASGQESFASKTPCEKRRLGPVFSTSQGDASPGSSGRSNTFNRMASPNRCPKGKDADAECRFEFMQWAASAETKKERLRTGETHGDGF